MNTTSAVLWSVFTLFISGMSVYVTTNVIRHSELFSELRAYIEARGGFVARVTSCGYCASFWVAIPFVIPMIITALYYYPLALMWAPVYWLCLVGVANLIHDLLRPIDQTPKVDVEHELADLDRIAAAVALSSIEPVVTGVSQPSGDTAGGDSSSSIGHSSECAECGSSDRL